MNIYKTAGAQHHMLWLSIRTRQEDRPSSLLVWASLETSTPKPHACCITCELFTVKTYITHIKTNNTYIYIYTYTHIKPINLIKPINNFIKHSKSYNKNCLRMDVCCSLFVPQLPETSMLKL